MKNVNVSSIFCDSDKSDFAGPVQLGQFIDELNAEANPNQQEYTVRDFTVVTFASAISDDVSDPDLRKKYDILWTFQPAGSDESNRLRLTSDILDLENNRVDKDSISACRSFSNQIFKFTVRRLTVGEVDKPYLLKIFMKEINQEKWEIQSINMVKIKKADTI